MADKASIAIKRQLATERIISASQNIASDLGVEALSLPLTGRDVNLLHAQQLEAVAGYLERIRQAPKPTHTATAVTRKRVSRAKQQK